jgi:flavin-dependent dehydrogenase
MVTGSKSTDVFVIGGGPAGIAAALAARQRGFDVTVADGCSPPIDKACGEGLMPDGVSALQSLGVNIPSIEAHRFEGIRFLSSGLSAEARFPYGSGLGVRRTNLHGIMVGHAESIGVRFHWRAVATGLRADGVLLKGGFIPARWIIGADGSNSQVRRWAGLDLHQRKEQRFAFRRHYEIAPWTEFMELHWGTRCQLYVTPVGPYEVCVAVISRDPKLRLDEALREFPEITKRLRCVDHGSVERGAISVTRRLARVYKERVALIGDASGGVDAITGEGLCLAFKQANLLADCLLSGDLPSYQGGHQALARRPALMARLMLLLEHREKLRRRVLRAFVAKPKLFAHMLATHVGAVSPVDFAVSGIVLGWKLLTA